MLEELASPVGNCSLISFAHETSEVAFRGDLALSTGNRPLLLSVAESTPGMRVLDA